MAQKCALIVDDSRTAREFLSRMLAALGLRVETAESAEDALEFLAHHRPDVVFMDHQMPGMDGLQAVKAIKSNPATATIPVMMYTSQSGELYVGQARALGAVGVLPKQIKPVEVEEVLRSLHLLPGQGAAPVRDASPTLPGVEALAEPADWSDLHRWLQQMLADHNRMLREDLETSVTRIIGEQLDAHSPPQRRRDRAGTGALILVLIAIAGLFFWLHLNSQARWQEAVQKNVQLMAALDAERRAGLQLPAAPLAPAPGPAQAAPLAGSVAAIEWSVNQSATYPPDQIPFSDARLQSLTGLMEQLRTLGFAGRVRLESHVGDFCLQKVGDSGWQPAPAELPVEKCDRVGLSDEDARAWSGRQSLAFANYLARLGAGEAETIRVELDSFGNSRPAVQYPAVSEGLTAGEWNVVAQANQRVEVRLIPDGPATASVRP